jgi:hypothetical protein
MQTARSTEKVKMYKAQYKTNNAYESWSTVGSYGSESEAINSAVRKKSAGAFMVRVVTSYGVVIFSS